MSDQWGIAYTIERGQSVFRRLTRWLAWRDIELLVADRCKSDKEYHVVLADLQRANAEIARLHEMNKALVAQSSRTDADSSFMYSQNKELLDRLEKSRAAWRRWFCEYMTLKGHIKEVPPPKKPHTSRRTSKRRNK